MRFTWVVCVRCLCQRHFVPLIIIVDIVDVVAYELGADIIIGDGAGVESVSDLLVGVRTVSVLVRVEPLGIARQLFVSFVAAFAASIQREYGFTEVGQLDGEMGVGAGDGADKLPLVSVAVSVAVSEHVFEVGVVARCNGRRRCHGWVYGDAGEHDVASFLCGRWCCFRCWRQCIAAAVTRRL